MPAYSPEPWVYRRDRGVVTDASDKIVCVVKATESCDVNGLLLAHAIPLLDVLRELFDAAEKCESKWRQDLSDAMERADGLLRKLE